MAIFAVVSSVLSLIVVCANEKQNAQQINV